MERVKNGFVHGIVHLGSTWKIQRFQDGIELPLDGMSIANLEIMKSHLIIAASVLGLNINLLEAKTPTFGEPEVSDKIQCVDVSEPIVLNPLNMEVIFNESEATQTITSSMLNNQLFGNLNLFNTTHRSGDTHRFLVSNTSKNMYSTYAFSGVVYLYPAVEDLRDALRLQFVDVDSQTVLVDVDCTYNPSQGCSSLAIQSNTYIPNQVSYSLIQTQQGEIRAPSPGLGEGVQIQKFKSAFGSGRWFEVRVIDSCGNTKYSRIRFN